MPDYMMKARSILLLFLSLTLANCRQTPGRAPAPVPGIAFVSNRDGNQEIYVLDLISGESWNVSNNPAADFWPSWSPALK
jgi:Tol biopolymer transport system component